MSCPRCILCGDEAAPPTPTRFGPVCGPCVGGLVGAVVDQCAGAVAADALGVLTRVGEGDLMGMVRP